MAALGARTSVLALGALVLLAAALALRADARPTQAAATAPARPFVTAVFPSQPADSELLFRRIRGSGATVARWVLPWVLIAKKQPATREQARDPGWEGYDWSDADRSVRLAQAQGLQPLLTILDAPAWAAEGPPKRPHGPWNIDTRALADFVHAAARRYSGSYSGLPRVRYWMLWNEPNLARYLNPQYVNGKPRAGIIYRGLLNAFADAVHGVRRDNLVVAGGTAPFTTWTPNTRQRWGMGPLTFMRSMLCLTQKPNPKPACAARAKFDVWAHHPYTTGGPTHKAFRSQDVSLGDMPEMRRVLDAAIRHRKITSRRTPQFWVTEFSWDTSPPDPGGVPVALHARWTAEALFQLWKSRVSLVTWYGLRDEPYPRLPFQGALYFNGGEMARDRAKPSLHVFRFPFVAKPRAGGRVYVWGRTPTSRATVVRIEQSTTSGWRFLGTVRANRYGVFVGTLRLRGRGQLRARAAGETSRTFALTGIKDKLYYPFGDWRP